MVKRIVLCCDGTWNTPDRPFLTNVTKLERAVPKIGTDGVDQIPYYQKGVGTGRWEHIRGGAFGYGLSRNVLDTYRFIVDHFNPGDELFFFGFSRGAFTARSTVGLVRNAGVLRREHSARAEEAYDLYRSRARSDRPDGQDATEFRRSFSHETRIRFIGVWDTVGALGIPVSEVPLFAWLNKRWSFHDTELSSWVDAAFQALAVDERRKVFKATLWRTHKHSQEQRVEQVWFSGSHGDVGGGTSSSSLSDIALLWMMDRARSCGLNLQEPTFPDGPPVDPDHMGPIGESRTGLYRLWTPFDREMAKDDPPHEYAAKTAVHRREQDPEYAPKTLVTYLDGSSNPQIMDV